jgi:hypothetical protein
VIAYRLYTLDQHGKVSASPLIVECKDDEEAWKSPASTSMGTTSRSGGTTNASGSWPRKIGLLEGPSLLEPGRPSANIRIMPDALDTLTEMHDLIARCRRMAVEALDRETAALLSQLADDLEACLRRSVFAALNAQSSPTSRPFKLHS